MYNLCQNFVNLKKVFAYLWTLVRVSNSKVQVCKDFDNTCKLLIHVVNSLFVGKGCILYCKVCVKICNS